MKRFSLELLYHIVGIGSASGIFYKDHTVFIVSDSGGYLYAYETQTKALGRTSLIEGEALENIPKRIKPDFEAMAEKDGKLYIFGSGSTKARHVLAIADLMTKKLISTEDLAVLYQAMRSESGISAEDFNIEGALAHDHGWYFFQRGNGAGAKNGLFIVEGEFDKPTSIIFKEYRLPKIAGVAATFTDAVLANGDLWFVASAEDSQSTYADGLVSGSLVGKIDGETLKIEYLEQISDRHKFEGIAFHSQNEEDLSFVLCEDNDSDFLESDVFKLTVGKDVEGFWVR